MLASVFAKTVRDRWRGWLIAFVSFSALFVFAMSIYRNIDLSIYTGLPVAFRAVLGVPDTADVASLSIQVMMSTYGAITIAAMAITMGAASIAGEESAGTIGLLLANPKSRTHVLVSKAAAMVVLSGATVLALWLMILQSASSLGVSIEGLHPGALSLHLAASAILYGMLAVAVGAWTGNRGVAVGASLGVMIVSYLAVGILPLFNGTDAVIKIFPWYYYNGSEPLINGVDWAHITVLAAASLLLAAAAVVGVNRRDLKSQSVGVTLLDRIRANPMAEKLIGRLAGAASVSSIWAKTASEYQGVLLVTSLYTFWVQGVMMGPLYAVFPVENFKVLANSGFPEAMLALVGGGNLTTAEGFYRIETFGMMAPIVVMVLTIGIGAGALAGEESRRTMGLLLANPVSRSRVLAEKAWTMVFYGAIVGFVTFAGVALGEVLGGLGMSIGNIAATCVLQTLVGLVFGALALALGAGTGLKKVAIFGAVGAALAMHLLNGFAAINDTMAAWAKLSPFHYYLGSDPLINGMNWGDAGVLAAITAVLIGASFVLFQRRDIRQNG